MADIHAIAQQFTDFYYQTFDSNRAGLESLYRPTSMLTWEGSPIQGVHSIVEKIVVRRPVLYPSHCDKALIYLIYSG